MPRLRLAIMATLINVATAKKELEQEKKNQQEKQKMLQAAQNVKKQ